MPLEPRSRLRTSSKPALDLPPLRLVSLREAGDAFVHATVRSVTPAKHALATGYPSNRIPAARRQGVPGFRIARGQARALTTPGGAAMVLAPALATGQAYIRL